MFTYIYLLHPQDHRWYGCVLVTSWL